MFYILFLTATVVTLSMWFYARSRPGLSRIFQSLFVVAAVGYLLSLSLSPGDWEAKWTTLIRDLGWMALVPALLSMLTNRKSAFFALLGLVAFSTGWLAKSTSFEAAATSEQDPVAEGEWELLLELKAGEDLSAIEDLVSIYGLTLEPAFSMLDPGSTELDDFYAVEIPERSEHLIDEIQDALSADAEVDWVEDNEVVTVTPIESRRLPPINRKFGLNDPQLEQQWAYSSLEMDRYFTYLREGNYQPVQKARIFILDTGVDAQHEDLQGQYQSVRSKYDKDVRGHGTHCAGIAGAVSDNNLGIASLAPGEGFVEISSIKVLSDYGSGSQRGIINGILEAADAGADVISMSLGGRSNTSRQRAYQEAVQYAQSKGAIVIVAAGNDGGSAKIISPANVPGVITVTAVDTVLQKANFSNSIEGLEMGIAAPGVAIYSTLPGSKYGALSGTSMATPFVAGLAGILRSFDPELTTAELYELLTNTGVETPNTSQTGKLVQPADALLFLLAQDDLR
jgi:thermitase